MEGGPSALEKKHRLLKKLDTPQGRFTEGGAGGQGLGLYMWVSVHGVDVGVSSLLGVAYLLPMNACLEVCVWPYVWASMFMAYVVMRCVCGQCVFVLLSSEFANPSMFSLNVH